MGFSKKIGGFLSLQVLFSIFKIRTDNLAKKRAIRLFIGETGTRYDKLILFSKVILLWNRFVFFCILVAQNFVSVR